MTSTLPRATALWLADLFSTASAFDCASLETVEGSDIASQIAPLPSLNSTVSQLTVLTLSTASLPRSARALPPMLNSQMLKGHPSRSIRENCRSRDFLRCSKRTLEG